MSTVFSSPEQYRIVCAILLLAFDRKSINGPLLDVRDGNNLVAL